MPKTSTVFVVSLIALAVGAGAAIYVPSLLSASSDGAEAADPGQPAPEAAVGAAAVALTVQAVPPEVLDWPVELRASGWIEPWQEAVIATEIGGLRIEAVHGEVGDQVAVGDVLVELSQGAALNAVRELEAQLASAEAVLETTTADADRARRLTGGGSLSQQQVAEYLSTERQAQASLTIVEAQLESARLDLSNTRILAVSGGTLSSRSAALGDVVAQGEELFRLIRDNRIEWQAEVPLVQLNNVTVGMEVAIPTPSGEPVIGIVRRVAPTVSEVNGRVIVYVELSGDAGSLPLRTGMLVSGALRVAETEAVTVPASAVVMRDGFSYVFTVAEGDPATVARLRIETGRRIGDRVEIVGDFDRTARVVQSGGAFLSDGSVVSVAAPSSDHAEEVGE